MKNYYLHRDGQNRGPFPEEQFKQMLASGEIGANEWVCEEGSSEWLEAASMQVVLADVGGGSETDDGIQDAQGGLEQPPQREVTSASRRRLVMLVGLGVVALIGVVVVGGILGKAFGRQVVKVLRHRADGVPPVHSFAAGDWATRELGDIALDAPYQFRPMADVSAKLPPRIRDAMVRFEVFDSGDGTNPQVSVSRMAYTLETLVSLDGAMNGAMSGAMKPVAESLGESNPQFSSTKTTLDGLPARRASYSGRKGKTVVHVDAIFVQSGQKLWQVQAISHGEGTAADAKRMLDSLHIKSDR